MPETPKMTPRERVRACLERRPVDRVPNALGGCETMGLHVVAYNRLKEVLGVDDPRTRVCTFMTNAIFEPSVLDAMDGDTILLGSRMCPSRFWGPGAEEEWKDLDIWGATIQVARGWDFRRDPDGSVWWGGAVCPPGGYYFDAPPPPPEESRAAALVDHRPSPDDYRPGHDLPETMLRTLEEQARYLHETTDRAIVCGEMLQDLQLQPGGMHAWWMRMVEEPEACHEFLGRACDAAIAQMRQLHDAVGRYCEIVTIAHDLGDRRGLFMHPDVWRAIYKPHYKRLFTAWREITGMKICLHTCGGVGGILPDLAECGLHIYNPVQISCDNMEPDRLKREAGDRLVFWGGALDSVLTPPSTDPDRVGEAARENIRALSRGGGYLLAGVHNLPADLPAEHLRALLDAWREVREEPELITPEN